MDCGEQSRRECHKKRPFNQANDTVRCLLHEFATSRLMFMENRAWMQEHVLGWLEVVVGVKEGITRFPHVYMEALSADRIAPDRDSRSARVVLENPH